MSLTVLQPAVKKNVMKVNQMPLVVVCQSEETRKLVAYVFKLRPKPMRVIGIPWHMSRTQQGFIFPDLESGTYQFVLFDFVPPLRARKTFELRVRRTMAVRAAAAGDEVEIFSPLTNDVVTTRLVPVSCIARDDDPNNIRVQLSCGQNHAFPAAEAAPDMVMSRNWFVTINVNEDPIHNAFTVTAHDSHAHSDSESNISVNPPGPIP